MVIRNLLETKPNTCETKLKLHTCSALGLRCMSTFFDFLFSKNSSDSFPSNLKCLYVFETSKLHLRLKANCSGSVNSSYFRELIALRMGYEVIKYVDTTDNLVKFKIKDDIDRSLEQRISEYICGGRWSWYSCSKVDHAKDFCSYIRSQFKPELDPVKKISNFSFLPEFEDWKKQMLNFRKVSCTEIESLPKTPAVVSFYHELLPEYFQ